MPDRSFRTRRKLKAVQRRIREVGVLLRGAWDTDHPIMAHLIPIRRCNLLCAYCNEYDDYSKPVPLDTMFHRIDHLARLRTSIVTMSGGEPLLHPDLAVHRSRYLAAERRNFGFPLGVLL